MPQKVETFEHVEVRGPGPQEARVEPNNAREARAIAESTTGRLFVVFLDTYHTEEGGSHRMQRVLVNLLNKVVGPDDMYAVMTPDMSAADISFARKTDVMEDYLAKYWFWGQRERLWPEDPVEQHYFECYPEQGMSSSCNSPLGVQRQADNVYAGIAREMVARRHEKKVLDAHGRPFALLARHPGRAQGGHRDLERLAPVPSESQSRAARNLRGAAGHRAAGRWS